MAAAGGGRNRTIDKIYVQQCDYRRFIDQKLQRRFNASDGSMNRPAIPFKHTSSSKAIRYSSSTTRSPHVVSLPTMIEMGR